MVLFFQNSLNVVFTLRWLCNEYFSYEYSWKSIIQVYHKLVDRARLGGAGGNAPGRHIWKGRHFWRKNLSKGLFV